MHSKKKKNVFLHCGLVLDLHCDERAHHLPLLLVRTEPSSYKPVVNIVLVTCIEVNIYMQFDHIEIYSTVYTLNDNLDVVATKYIVARVPDYFCLFYTLSFIKEVGTATPG